MRASRPSPLWGRGWPATGVFISRGRTGEGVKPVKTRYPYRKTRQPSQAKSDAGRDAHLATLGYTVRRFPNGIVLEAPELCVQKVLRLVWSLPEALD